MSIFCCSLSVGNISLHFQTFISLLIAIIQWDFSLHKESYNSQCSTQRSDHPVWLKWYLVGAPFALITASIRRGMEVISLWHCWGGMEAQVSLTVAFSSSAFFGLLFLIFLLTIPHRFSMFRSGEFAGQSSTPTPWSFNQLLVLLAVWAGAKPCWKMKSASLKSWFLKHEVLQNLLVNGCSDVGFQKTQWTNTSRWHCTANHHRLWKLHTGLQATWASPSFPQTLGPWFPNEIQNLLSSEKRTLDHWATVQFFFS